MEITDYILAAAIGGLTAFIFTIPAIALELAERGKVKNIPLLVDVKTILGRKLHGREVFAIAVLVHILLGIVFGFFYVVFVQEGWLFVTGSAYSLLSLIIYSLGVWIVNGFVLFPALGMGAFGRREGRRVWMEMLISSLLLALGMWAFVQYYQPAFFMN